MNKIFKSMMAVAITAFTFTACEDVPEPYNNPYDSIKPAEPEVVIEPAGTGIATDPYNVAAVIKACEGLADGAFLNDSKDIYVTGIVTETTEISTSYGNATYYISDNAKGSNRFYVYRGKLLDNADVKADTDLQVGDSVTVCGKIKNYKGTMEFDQGNYLVFYKKGEGGSSEQLEAPGTEEAPLTVAEALTYIDKLGADKQSPVGFVKGKICAIGEVDTGQYGNATYSISDDGTENNALQIYRGYSLGGEKFKSADEIKVGDEVIITGKLVNFKGNTKQFAQGSQIVELNGQKAGSDEKPEPVVTGDNILANGDFEAWTSGQPDNWKSGNTASSATLTQSTDAHAGTYAVKVGHDASGNKRLAYKELTLRPGTYAVSFYVKAADAAGASVNPGYASTGSDSKLSYNYDGYVNDITTEWQQVTYNFTLSAETVVNLIVMVPKNSGTDVIIDDFTLATSDGGIVGGGEEKPDTPTDEVKAITVAEFIAAPESTDVWYKLTGTIKNLNDGDLYGNFDLEDATGSVYVYGVLSEKGGAKKLFQELVTKYGLANGSTITIIGNRGSYTNKNTGETKIEVLNAYIVVDGNGGNDTPNTETGADGSTIISVADFNAAAESTDVWYQLTGTISNLKDGDQYGNFDLTDATGSVYVYGVLSEKGGAKKKFQELVEAKGIANGKKITIVGNRGSYNNKIEVMNAYFIKVE